MRVSAFFRFFSLHVLVFTASHFAVHVQWKREVLPLFSSDEELLLLLLLGLCCAFLWGNPRKVGTQTHTQLNTHRFGSFKQLGFFFFFERGGCGGGGVWLVHSFFSIIHSIPFPFIHLKIFTLQLPPKSGGCVKPPGSVTLRPIDRSTDR